MSTESIMRSNYLNLCHPFSSSLQSFLASGSLPLSQLFASGGQKIEASASVSVLSVNSGLISFGVDWFDSLQSKGLSRVLSSTTVKKASVLWCSVFFIVQLSHPYMTTGKTIALTIWTFVGKVMSLLFNTKSRFIIVFLPRCKRRLISWL